MEQKVHNKKILKAVAPYYHPEFLNFKQAPFDAWRQNGGMVAKEYYPPRFLHGFAFRWELPTIWKRDKEARLRFVEPVSLPFDTFPDYARYEVIPMFWDCWPCYFEKTVRWLLKHQVKTAIFSSRQTAERMQEELPNVNIIWCAEAVDDYVYDKGELLKDREIDLLEFGRSNDRIINSRRLDSIKIGNKEMRHICTKKMGNSYLPTNNFSKRWAMPRLQ